MILTCATPHVVKFDDVAQQNPSDAESSFLAEMFELCGDPVRIWHESVDEHQTGHPNDHARHGLALCRTFFRLHLQMTSRDAREAFHNAPPIPVPWASSVLGSVRE